MRLSETNVTCASSQKKSGS